MRLWHQLLIPKLSRAHLLGQHRECCALRGGSWKKPHRIVNYVFEHSPYKLYLYHQLIMEEMKHRGYNVDANWYNPLFRGYATEPWTEEEIMVGNAMKKRDDEKMIYKEHDDSYLQECIENLKGKGYEVEGF